MVSWKAPGVRRSPFRGCQSSRQAFGVCCLHAVGTAARAWGPSTDSLACMSCDVVRAAGVARGCRGEAPFAVLRGVWGQAPSHPRLPLLGASSLGPHTVLPWREGGTSGDQAPTLQRTF